MRTKRAMYNMAASLVGQLSLVLVTLISALRSHGQRRGIATLCIGGGEATAMAVEVLS